MKKIVFLLGCMAFCLMACEKNTLDIPKRQPMVKINSITAHSANISVSLEEIGGNSDPYHAPHSTVDSVVLVLADNVSMANPTIYKKQPQGSPDDYNNVSFSTTSLSSNKTYYCYALITNSAFSSPIQSEITSFTTREVVTPEITTDSVPIVYERMVSACGTFKEKGSGKVIKMGFYYKADTQSTGYYVNVSSTKIGTFSYEITALSPNTTYYIQAYCQTEDTTVYGEKITFTTYSLPQLKKVDLGTGVYWANININQLPDYYAWGETETKESFTQENYIYYYRFGSYPGYKKYTRTTGWTVNRREPDFLSVLESRDDVACIKLKDSWRIPTSKEIQDLLNMCTWKWMKQNGFWGYEITGSNGNSIFLPAMGYQKNTNRQDVNVLGRYWANDGYDELASVLDFSSTNKILSKSNGSRWLGYSVRAVCPK